MLCQLPSAVGLNVQREGITSRVFVMTSKSQIDALQVCQHVLFYFATAFGFC